MTWVDDELNEWRLILEEAALAEARRHADVLILQFVEKFLASMVAKLPLITRMTADGWPELEAWEYARTVPAEACWLYPVPVWREGATANAGASSSRG